MNLLLLAGDVETNPGPDLAHLAKQLQAIAGDLKEIKEERLTAIDKKLELLESLYSKITMCTDQVTHLQKVVSDLELKLDDLENRSRRGNLIVYGIPEKHDEDDVSLEQTVNDTIIKETLQLEPVTIERIHRLGKPDANKTRPVILKLLDTRDKTKILKNCHKLKGTKLAISEDFSARVRSIRKKLWDSAKHNKESGDKVRLVHDKISINQVLYRWDDTVGDKVEIKTERNAPSTQKNQKNQEGTPPMRTRRQQYRPK